MSRKSLIAFVLAGLLIATACASKRQESRDIQRMPNGDLRESTVSVDRLPGFLDKQRTEVQQIYRLAAHHAELLQWIPCYCGCGDSAGHRSNRDCFVNDIREDGSILWDDHGTRCAVCLEIAVHSAQMNAKGLSPAEIRAAIDQTYSDSRYAPPTPTPLPN